MLVEDVNILTKIKISNDISNMAKELLLEGDITEKRLNKFRADIKIMTARTFTNSPTLSEVEGLEEKINSESRLVTRFVNRDIIYSTFSNHPILIDNILFKNVEVAYQYYKDPSDTMYLVNLLSCNHPSQARDLGNSKYIKSLEDYSVDGIKMYNILYTLILNKFIQYRDLRDTLINDDVRFIRASYIHDSCCRCDDCLRVQFTNYLGKIILITKDEVKRICNINV